MNTKEKLVTLETLEPGDEVEKDVGGVMVRRRILDATKVNGWLISSRPYNEKDGLHDSDRGAEVVTPYYLLNTDYKPVQPAHLPAPIGVDRGSKDGDHSAYVYGTHNPDGTTTIDRVETVPAPAEYLDGTFSEVRYAEGPMSREQFEGFFKDCIEQKPAPAEKEEEWWQPIANEMSEATFDDAAFYKERDAYISRIVTEAKRRGAEEAWKEAEDRLAQEMEAIRGLEEMGMAIHQKSTYKAGVFQAYRIIKSKRCQNLNKPAGAGEK